MMRPRIAPPMFVSHQRIRPSLLVLNLLPVDN
jgi:hypothetical protein